jgi:hypothetical protein
MFRCALMTMGNTQILRQRVVSAMTCHQGSPAHAPPSHRLNTAYNISEFSDQSSPLCRSKQNLRLNGDQESDFVKKRVKRVSSVFCADKITFCSTLGLLVHLPSLWAASKLPEVWLKETIKFSLCVIRFGKFISDPEAEY